MLLNKTIPHSKKLRNKTEKSIRTFKNNKHTCLFGKKPKRTLKILNNYQKLQEIEEHAYKEESESDDENFYENKDKVEQELKKKAETLFNPK